MLSLLTTLFTLSLAAATPVKRAVQTFNIHPSNQGNLCLGTTLTPANGVVLSDIPCTQPNGTTAYLDFDLEPTVPGVIRLHNTNFCIDAGLGFNELKLWTCYPGVAQQNWIYTGNGDNHFALFGGTNCLSSNNGGSTVRCGPDSSQVWNLTPPGGTPTNNGNELRFNGQCVGLTVHAAPIDGTLISTAPCLPATDPNKYTQLWNIPVKGTDGLIRLAGTNQCIDAGVRPLANGRFLKTWTCYPGLYQQTWFHTGDDHLAITGDTQCMDVRREGPPPGSLGNIQTWQCSGNDPQQLFTVS